MILRFSPSTFVYAIVLVAFSTVARAEDAFFRIATDQLKITSGELPKTGGNTAPPAYYSFGPAREYRAPYAVLDGEGEIYPLYTNDNTYFTPVTVDGICVRIPAGTKEIKGAIYSLNSDDNKMRKVTFTVPGDKADPQQREAFYRAKEQFYQRLLNRRSPGGSWFRYQANAAAAAREGKNGPEFVAAQRAERPLDLDQMRFDDTFEIFSGGRAISENLQLDRLLPTTNAEEPTVDISSLGGITVAEMDWTALTKDLKPELDPLAAIIPSDQHVLLFPTFGALMTIMDEADANGTPILNAAEPRSESARTRERYEKQLCLSATALARLLGDQVVASVAFTGSDPYLPTGTDVAVLFEAKNAAVLQAHIVTQQAAAIKADPACKIVDGSIGAVKYHGAASPDRSVSSYVVTIGKSVVVTNSLYQLKRILETSTGSTESLGSLPEYKFFRDRYPRGKDESGLLIVTDKTIRRWCSAKWRIAASRRTRAVAIMSHYQAQYAKDLVNAKVEPHDITTILQVPDLGTLRLTKAGVSSSTYGSLEFQTPIAELDLTKVTKTESQTYERWREGYQRNWSQFFDPIAVSFTVKNDRLLGDLTVMPLIDSSQYREFIEIASGVELKPTSGDPHAGSLMHWTMAINPNSERMKWASGSVETFTRTRLLGWIGESISVYADPDPFWTDLAEAMKANESAKPGSRDPGSEFMEKNLHRVPVAVTIEVKDTLKLALFLGGIRAFIEQAAPGLVLWTNLEHNGHPYVKVSPTESGKQSAPFANNLAIHYAATPDQFTLTLNEDLLKRALDRRPPVAKDKPEGGKKEEAPAKTEVKKVAAADTPPSRSWLGKSMAFQIDRAAIEMFERVFGNQQYQELMQALAWSNIAILNEWKKAYPDRDPVEVHQRLWQTTILCPGGGKYIWNEEFRTMESTVYGHPGQPKTGAGIPLALATAKYLDFGLTFENRGLRAKVEIGRQPAKK